jgi:hypothetical protein
MLEALKNSPEDKKLVEIAAKYLRGVKGTLVQQKKKDREKAMMMQAGGGTGTSTTLNQPQPPYSGLQKQQPQPQPQPQFAGPATAYHASRPPQFEGVPEREMPTYMYNQQQQQQRAQQGSNGHNLDDHDVESALRGFLGR